MSSSKRSSSRSSRSGLDLLPLTQVPSVLNEGYDFSDPGPAPDDRKTGRSVHVAGTTLSQEHDIYTRQSPSQRLQDISLRKYKREIDGGWRVQLRLPRPQSAIAQLREDSITEFEILRNRNRQDAADNETITFPTLTCLERGPPGPAIGTPETLGHISHDRKHVMTKSAFTRLVLDHGHPAQDSGILGLAKRLLKRVYSSDERHYVGGKFLLPTAIRYDGQSKNPGEEEKPCLFFNFPYLSLEHHHCSTCARCNRDGPEDHPMRSLFQFRYRLQNTRVKDGAQVVANMDAAIISRCLPGAVQEAFIEKCGREAPLIHVPQLWIAMISGDLLCTSGPISEKDLKGQEVRIEKTSLQEREHDTAAPPLVRIIFDHSVTTEYFTYPMEQCCWWFALLNKRRIILSNYNRGDTSGRKDYGPGGPDLDSRSSKVNFAASTDVTAQEYIFCLDETPTPSNHITIYNWGEILSNAGKRRKERLDIWLRKRAPDLSITVPTAPTMDTSSSSAAVVAPISSQEPTSTQLHPISLSTASTAFASSSNSQLQASTKLLVTSPSASSQLSIEKLVDQPDHSFKGVPFFCWPIIDDFRKASDLPGVERAAALLELVYQAFCNSNESNYNTKDILSASSDGKLLAMPSAGADVIDYNYRAVYKFLKQAKGNMDRDTSDVLLEFLARCQSLANFYIPAEPDDALPPPLDADNSVPRAVLLYWSLVRAIIVAAENNTAKIPTVRITTGHVKEIQRLARELHLGTELASFADGRSPTSFSPNRVVLETIVRSLAQVFDLLAATLVKLCTPSDDGSQVTHIASAAQRCLADAKDQLIVEADDLIREKGLGSVVTPEAIMVMLLQRLSAGVYNDQNVEILEIYEQLVESIALKLDSERGASRRLLLKINSLIEELDIVLEVLRQQSAILKMFRQALDPESFEKRSVHRQISFDIESDCIDQILSGVEGRTIECEELKERTERLAEQNVQLVETQQDDNSKAIMVFTIVTVLFLPPSFISSYFGMNLEGISDSTSGPGHFWYIAAPLTASVTLLCVLLVYFTTIKRKWTKRRDVRREGNGLLR